jgi:basic membrane protein A
MLRSSFAKLTFVLLTLVVVAGCGQAQPTAVPTAAPTTQPTAEPTAQTQAQPTQAADKTLIAFAFSSVVSDNGWTYVHNQGRLAAEAALPQITTKYVEMVPYSEEASRTFEQFIADGAKMIIVAAEYGEFIYKVAAAHPDIPFLEANGATQSANVSSYYFEHTRVDYLLGVAAGLLTKSNKIGFITSFPIPINYAEANAFLMGARSVNPNVTENVVTINAWFDPQAHRQAAEALVDSGVDFLFANLDDTSSVEVAGQRGVWVASAWTERQDFAPETYVNTLLVDWGPFYTSEIQAALDGTWQGNRSVILPLGGGIDLGQWGQKVPQDVRDQVEAVRQKMLNEGFNPFVGPINDATGQQRIPPGEELTPEYRRTQWDWAVEGVVGLP